MTRATLLDLAARVEAAQGPDRELDAEVVAALAAGATVTSYLAMGLSARKPKPYTASLDAADTLRLPGWWITSGTCAREAHASAGREGTEELVVEAFAPPGREAQARTAAWLRARAEESSDGE